METGSKTPEQIRQLLTSYGSRAAEGDQWLTRKEIAKHFGVSPDAVAHYAKKKNLEIRVVVTSYFHGTFEQKQPTCQHNLKDFYGWKPLKYRNSEWHQK
jgi:hypothetical protein